MENLNLIIFICLAIPFSMMIFLFKGQSRKVCTFLLIGIFMCVLAGEINGLIVNSVGMELEKASINIAPLVEETVKAIPIIFITFLFKPNEQRIAEYSLATGVGFATLENISILMSTGNITFSYAFLRAIGAGMMHGVCTLTVGIALVNIANKRIVAFSGTLASLSIAVIYHSIYNMLITSDYMIVGVLLPIATFALILVVNIIQNKGVLKKKEK